MKTMVTFILLCIWACSNNDGEGNIFPDIPFTADIIVENLPDSIQVNSTVEFSFMVESKQEKIYLNIDTIVPVYINRNWIDWEKVPESATQVPPEAMLSIIRKGVKLEIDNKKLTTDFALNTNEKHSIRFSEPEVVGDYKIIFSLKNESGKIFKKEITIKVYSPEIEIVFYNVDPWLNLQILDKNYFEELNKRYTYKPLSDVFKNKEIDTLHTYQCPKPGLPNELTFPGLGITVHIAQDNSQGFVYQIDERDIKNSFFTNWDNDIRYPARTLPQKNGFHCLELTAWENAQPGFYIIDLSLTDYWGKNVSKTLYLKAHSYQ